MADNSTASTVEKMAKSIEPVAEPMANKSDGKAEHPMVKSIQPMVKSLDATVKSFNEWLVEHGHPTIPSNDSTPTQKANSIDNGWWSVPIISYGNDEFGWHQRESGNNLFLDFNRQKGIHVTRGQEHKGASLFGAEEGFIGNLTAAISSIDLSDRPVIRVVFAIDMGKTVKTKYRNVKYVDFLTLEL
ncbi:MAG: hypothetical protein Q9174_007083 [Haloplaca sp. 1 TL-2023]